MESIEVLYKSNIGVILYGILAVCMARLSETTAGKILQQLYTTTLIELHQELLNSISPTNSANNGTPRICLNIQWSPQDLSGNWEEYIKDNDIPQ